MAFRVDETHDEVTGPGMCRADRRGATGHRVARATNSYAGGCTCRRGSSRLDRSSLRSVFSPPPLRRWC